MNKNNIKTFAVWARRQLIYEIKKKLEKFGIFEDSILKYEIKYESEISKKYRDELIEEIYNKGFKEVIEEAAYIWFIKVVTLRYIKINNFVKDESEALSIISSVFYSRNNYIEILIPNELIYRGEILEKLSTDISEEDFKCGVEIIGWLYQYYMSEKKDDIFHNLKENIKITKENIPAATQLFTPKWIVKYMVENSLGRVITKCKTNSDNPNKTNNNYNFKEKWNYYLDEENRCLDNTRAIDEYSAHLNIEDIKVIDPCMGAGHILVYSFDLFYDIYKKLGYDYKKIPRLILENNLYGLDIDEKAVQICTFALIMKGREYNNDFFDDIQRDPLKLNICNIEESNDINIEYVNSLLEEKINKKMLDTRYSFTYDLSQNRVGLVEWIKNELKYLIEIFKDAKYYGSTLEVKDIDFKLLREIFRNLRDDNEFTLDKNILIDKILNLLKQGEIISRKYDAVITNPPYMGLRGVNYKMSKYLCERYPISKYDMFSVYMEVCQKLLKANGIYAMITPHSWMFLSSFEYLREKLLNEGTFINMIHLGTKAFEENVGTIVQNVAFVFKNGKIPSYKTKIIDLRKEDNSIDKKLRFIYLKNHESNRDVYNINLEEFMKIPTKSIAYWMGDDVVKLFRNLPTLSSITKPRQGIATSDNKKFLRNWFEVDKSKIKFDSSNKQDAVASEKKWFPYNKGGDYRKWYGNNEYIINWENDGKEVKEYAAKLYKSYSRTIKNEEFFFRNGLTYTFISEDIGVRYCPNGFIFDVAGSSIFFEDNDMINVTLGFLCSKVAKMFLDIMNPTYNIQVGNIKNIPIKEEMYICPHIKNKIEKLVLENIEISKDEWDSFEISWDFKTHPLIKRGLNISEAFRLWSKKRSDDFYRLKKNEEDINKIFIKLYGLENKLSEKVDDNDITIRKADLERDIRSLISYAIGCIFGRYEIEKTDVYEKNNYFAYDNILIITESEYFENDIVNKFISFISYFYGEENLEENLKFIAYALNSKSKDSSRNVIRKYFLKNFYKDHLKIYKKKPIYWMFDSGKNNGFKALIYMHRYDENLVGKIKKEYISVVLRKYEEERKRLFSILDSYDSGTKEEISIRNDIYKISNKIDELTSYMDIVAYFSYKRVTLDLDDGIRSNYYKFQGINIIKSNGEEVKMNLLHKI